MPTLQIRHENHHDVFWELVFFPHTFKLQGDWFVLGLFSVFLFSATAVWADTSPQVIPHTPPTKVSSPSGIQVVHRPGKGVEIDLLGNQNWVITLGAMAFARFEYINNSSDLQFAKDDHDLYTATRFRMSLGIRLMRHLGVVMTVQDARFWGNGLPLDGRVRFRSDTEAVFAGQLFLGVSLFEGYMYLDRPWNLPLRLEIGRMILEYGNGFVLGDPAFGVQGQSLDTVRLRWMPGRWTVDLLWAKLRATVEYNNTTTCTQGCVFEGDDLIGLYAAWKINTRHQWDIYGFFYLQAPPANGIPVHSGTWITGTRYSYKTQAIDSYLELILETGSVQQKLLVAFGGLGQFVYTFQSAMTPFLGVQLLLGTGGEHDSVNTSFIPLFSRRRRFYGQINMFATTNLIQPAVILGFHPHPKVTIRADVRQSFMMDPKGSLVNGGHVFLAKNSSGTTHVLGMEIDFSVGWRPVPFVLFDAVAGVFLPMIGDTMALLQDATGQPKFGRDPAMIFYLRSWVNF